MTVSLHNRRKLEEAMRRLLDGSATTADGKLTWKERRGRLRRQQGDR